MSAGGPPLARSIGYIATNNSHLNVNVPEITPPSYMSSGYVYVPPSPPSFAPSEPPIVHNMDHVSNSSGGPLPTFFPIVHSMGHVSNSSDGPLPTTPQVLSENLVPGEEYHIWTSDGGDFKQEGFGKFVRLQGSTSGIEAVFQPFTILHGAQLESQVFKIGESYFYKSSNMKGGKRKSRKSRRRSRKSRRHSRK